MNDTYGITVDTSVFDSFNSIQAVDLTCKGVNWAWDRTNALETGQALGVAGQDYTIATPAWNGDYQWLYDESDADNGEWINLGNGFYTRYVPSTTRTICDEQEKRYKLKYR